MSNSRQIKQRIKTAQNISKITKAMEMVSASKMRRAQEQALATRPYTRALQESLQKLANEVNTLDIHPYLVNHKQGIDIAIIISTDKGLCGGLNQNLLKTAINWQKEHPNSKIVVVGRKAVTFARVYGLDIHAQFTDLPDTVGINDTIAVSTLISQAFLDQEFRTVDIIYMDFISTLVQKVRTVQLLPLPKKITEVLSDEDKEVKEPSEYLFEPSPKEILNDLLNYYLENTVYQSFLEAKASEHSARMVAMKNASENAGELMQELKLQFNKTRQAGITNELLDITTAILAQKQKGS